MTNNPTIDGVSRELLKDMHEHPDCPVEFIDHLRRLLDAPVVEPASDLREHCKQCAEVVKTWPEWKQNCLGGAPVVERQPERYKPTVPKFKFDTLVEHCKRLERDLAEARAHVNEITLYQQNAVWFWQHDGEDYLQSLSCPIIIQPHHLRELLEGKAQHNPIAAPPAPVAVVIDERAEFDAWAVKHGRVVGYNGWRNDFEVWRARACLDVTAALNKSDIPELFDVAGDADGLVS